MRQYLEVTVFTKSGEVFNNPLTLSESYLVSQLAQQNKRLEIQIIRCTALDYKRIFG